MDTTCISRKLEQLSRAATIPGVQLAVHHDQQSWTCELGEEESGTGRLLTKESKVPIGSVSKTFTAALAMVLLSDGDLDLDTPVTEYLPDLRRAAGELAGLTPRHLLSHTGGLPSDPDQVRATTRRRHILDCLRRMDPLLDPGHAFSYSNLGYVIAGHLIETVTGMSWSEAMEAVLLQPLGLRPAFVVGPGARGGTATGHAVNPAQGRVRPVRQSLAAVDAPAGAVAASATDLVALGRLLAGTAESALIEPAVLAEMLTPVPGAEPFGVADGWGLGVAVYHDEGRTWIGHDGTGDGTSAHLRVDPDGGTVVAMTTNASTGFPTWHRFVGELRETGFHIGDYRGAHDFDRATMPPSDCQECIGTYRNGELEYAVVDESGTLHLTMDGEPFAELTMYAGLVFTMRDLDTGETDMTGRFLRDTRTGAIGWIQVGGRLARRPDRVREVA